MNKTHSVTIMGTGQYGLALGKRLVTFGFHVVYGSRQPNKNFISKHFRDDQDYVQLLTINEAWSSNSKIVFFAVNIEAYDDLVTKLMSSDNSQVEKIVLDVSNGKDNKSDESSAEMLQNFFNKHTDKINVIKAFNNVSAISMNFDFLSKAKINDEMILVAGNDCQSVREIISLANKIGFQAFEIGLLNRAKKLELSNGTVFKEWQHPTLFITGFLIFNLIWYFFYSYFSNAKYSNFDQYLKAFSLLPYLNRVFAFTSINLLSYVYLAGIVAISYKFHYGKKTKRFPKYLDTWLKSRKQLGLWAFFFATLHALLTLCILTPAHFSPWFKAMPQPKFTLNSSYFKNENSSSFDVTTNAEFKQTGLTFYAELNIITGVISYSIMLFLAICSINSIASSLNWSEWTFVQSKCGLLCLFFSLLHDVVMYLRFIFEKDVHKYTNKHILTRVKLYTIWVPLVVLILRLLFMLGQHIMERIERAKNVSLSGKYKSCETSKV